MKLLLKLHTEHVPYKRTKYFYSNHIIKHDLDKWWSYRLWWTRNNQWSTSRVFRPCEL